MVNGELAFDAPWQGRAFGIARGLAERGVYEWDDFRAALIEQIGGFDRAVETRDLHSSVPTPQFHYYDHFLRALETLLVARNIIAPGELIERVHAFEIGRKGTITRMSTPIITTIEEDAMSTRPIQMTIQQDGRKYGGIYSVSGNLMIARIPGVDSRSRMVNGADEAALAQTLFKEILTDAKRDGRLAG
jgi:nitrile hydratase accessory protein